MGNRGNGNRPGLAWAVDGESRDERTLDIDVSESYSPSSVDKSCSELTWVGVPDERLTLKVFKSSATGD